MYQLTASSPNQNSLHDRVMMATVLYKDDEQRGLHVNEMGNNIDDDKDNTNDTDNDERCCQC